MSEEDEISYYDTREYFTESGFRGGSKGALDQVNMSGETNTQCMDMENSHVETMIYDPGYPQIVRRKSFRILLRKRRALVFGQ